VHSHARACLTGDSHMLGGLASCGGLTLRLHFLGMLPEPLRRIPLQRLAWQLLEELDECFWLKY
jgi:hypothetical protein